MSIENRLNKIESRLDPRPYIRRVIVANSNQEADELLKQKKEEFKKSGYKPVGILTIIVKSDS